MDVLHIDKELKIRSVTKVWEKIKKNPLPVVFDFKDFKKFDCAGLQLFLYILKLSEDHPESYKISGINDDMLSSLPSYGYMLNKGEHIK